MSRHIRNPQRTIDADLVKTLLHAAETRFVSVSFIKKDGTLRTVNGLLRPASHIVGNERGQRQSDTMRAHGLIPIWNPRDGWKSFKADRVTVINIDGATVASA